MSVLSGLRHSDRGKGRVLLCPKAPLRRVQQRDRNARTRKDAVMKFCDNHWGLLRRQISAKGIDHLVAQNGQSAARMMKDQLETEEVTIKNFDPLMSAYWAICSNVLESLTRAGSQASIGYLMSHPDDPEDQIDIVMRVRLKQAGINTETWPRCPLCYLNLAHAATCTDRKCVLDRERGYDWMLERAADDAKRKADELLAGKDT